MAAGDGPPVSTLTVHACVEGAMGDYIMRGCIVEHNLEEGGNGVGSECPWGQKSKGNRDITVSSQDTQT